MRVLLSLLFVLILAVPGHADEPNCDPGLKETSTAVLPFNLNHSHCHEDIDTDTDTDTDTNEPKADKDAADPVWGAKVDLPNLVRLTENSTIGVEAGKDLYETGANEGWFGFVKFTWIGTFFDFSKDD